MAEKKPYPDVDANPDFPALEQEILGFWKETRAFERSVENRAEEGSRYVFYDGPPFANGLPHYGHLLTGYVKDTIARYQTMRGKHVERRFGWDCHGLPAEMGAEKELGISGRAAIINFGIDKFNAHCRTSVMKYAHEWEYYVNRQGRWVDFAGDYKTMDTPFMESVLWAFKQLYDKGLIYESMRVMPYSWAAETPLSNFETKLDNSYRDRDDKAAYVRFKLKDKPEFIVNNWAYANSNIEIESINLVAWTTTPWTLPSNLALAVNKELQYVARYIPSEKTIYIFAVAYAPEFLKVKPREEAELEIAAAIKGEDLVGLTYEPLFPYFAETKNAFRILDGSSFVTEGEGTGVVHIAPGFGEDDFNLCARENIPVVVPVDGRGFYTSEVGDLAGLHVIWDEASNHKNTGNEAVLRALKDSGALLKQEQYRHSYPHCWRTDTPLIYRALPSWYVEVTKFRDRAAELNQQINWIPGHVRDGQMDHMLKTAPDWSISRNRFWGTPIPVWRSTNPQSKEPIKVFGSIAELEKFFGKKVEDLHRPFIDTLVAPDPSGGEYRRVDDVFDCWFESGSMPFAQLHYPFENKDQFEKNFPADFITEYVGQTRGWFNTLIMLSTALFDKPPFKNCICHGVVLDAETGQKYSKRLKNYKDPKEVMDGFGADALRWMMLASPVMRGADIGVDPEGKFIRDVVRLNIKPLWSAYNFFTLYANADKIVASHQSPVASKKENLETGDWRLKTNLLDRYILAKCKAAVTQAQTSLDAYDTTGATDAITAFFDVLNNWYIRRSRARFWGSEVTPDKQAAYDTLYTVLLTMVKVAAPLLPFATEAIYRGLTGAKDSVHLQDFPDVRTWGDEAELVADMDRVRDACTAMASIRNTENIRNRQPLASATLYGAGAARLKTFEALMQDELNIKEIRFADSLEGVAEYTLTVNFQVAGKRLGAKMKAVGAAAKSGDWKNENGALIVGGEKLSPEEYKLSLKPLVTKGAASLSSNDALVVLNLTITPELEAEGRARDLVRMIQQARKDAGLHVADRIALSLDIPADFASALAAHQDYIAEQTLAVSFSKDASKAEKRLTQELDGAQFVIGISKAA